MRTRRTGISFFASLWASATARNRSRMLLYFCPPRWRQRSMDKYSVPTMAEGLEIVYEGGTRAISAHVDARILRLCTPSWMHARSCAPGGLFQPGVDESQGQSADRRQVPALGNGRRSRETLDR